MNTPTSEYKKYLTYTIVLFSISFAIKVLFTLTTHLSLFTEEAQYWLWSRNLDWSYYSKPVMIAIFNFISTSILGHTEFAIRINALIITFLMGLITYQFAWELYKKPRVAFFSAVILLVMPHFHLNSMFNMTDTPLGLFWILSLYFLWKATESGSLMHWSLAGFAVGLAFLSKFLVVLIFPVLFLYLFLYHRKQLLSKQVFAFLLIFLLFTIPVIVWNIQNDFVTFKHVGTLGGAGAEKKVLISESIKYFGEYVGGQLGINSPFLVFFMVAAIVFFLRKNDKRAVLLGLPAIIAFLGFLFVSTQKRVEVNWPTFSYLTLPILTAAYFSERNKLRLASVLSCITGFLLFVITFPQLFDPIGLHKALPPKKDPFVRMAGHREVGAEISSLIESFEMEKYFVFSDSYHYASEAAFYTEGNPQTYCINLGRRMNQFDLWPGIEQFENDSYVGIYVTTKPELDPIVSSAFGKLVDKRRVEGWHRGVVVGIYYVYVLDEFRKMEQEPLDSF